jgi:hypothetical protein
MLRYKFRTLLILLAVMPPLGAWAWHQWRARLAQHSQRRIQFGMTAEQYLQHQGMLVGSHTPEQIEKWDEESVARTLDEPIFSDPDSSKPAPTIRRLSSKD